MITVWISAVGVWCIGTVIGYVLFYWLKPHQPPITESALSTSALLALLTAIGAGGAIGAALVSLEETNYPRFVRQTGYFPARKKDHMEMTARGQIAQNVVAQKRPRSHCPTIG